MERYDQETTLSGNEACAGEGHIFCQRLALAPLPLNAPILYLPKNNHRSQATPPTRRLVGVAQKRLVRLGGVTR